MVIITNFMHESKNRKKRLGRGGLTWLIKLPYNQRKRKRKRRKQGRIIILRTTQKKQGKLPLILCTTARKDKDNKRVF